MKKRLWQSLFFIILIILSTSAAFGKENWITPVYSGSISSVTRLDLTEGKIIGAQAIYELTLPNMWCKYLVVERENSKNQKGVLEKIIFSYQPREKTSKPIYLMSLYVYNKSYWNENLVYDKILESEDYVFAMETTKENIAVSQMDQTIFQWFIEEMEQKDQIAQMIILSQKNKIIRYHSVSVNGSVIQGKTIADQKGALYIPVRAVCETLGYEIGWLDHNGAVTISKDSFYYILSTKSSLEKQFPTLVHEGSVYAPSLFYIQILQVHIEIDENNNVMISTAPSIL